MPRRVARAIFFSFLLHGGLILARRYQFSYDAYNHMFFADHYRLNWWSLWEPRWYAGFTVASYPPLSHQLIALLSRWIGVESAFAIVLWTTMTIFPLAVYCFTRCFIGKPSAGYAALGAAFLPSAYLAAHIFGQLPTLIATTSALFGIAALSQYLNSGRILDGLLAISLMTTVMAFHHATLLLLPCLILGLLFHIYFKRHVSRQALAGRILFFGIFSILGILLVIWPFWEWGRHQEIQTTIDHLSRHNFIKDPLAIVLFFVPMYGPLALVIPLVPKFWSHKRFFGLAFAFGLLFLLGLGDTTPLPRLFFGKGWEWLTYDRFAFWASIVLLPFFAMLLTSLRRKYASTARKLTELVFAALAVSSLIVGLVTLVVPLQPGRVNMDEVVHFLSADQRDRWRYLTFGFGDQLAYLSILTPATTIDGSYHTARSIPELHESGIGQIDTAYWSAKGLAALDPILQISGSYGVRWGFVNVQKYIPVLKRNGWIYVKTLKGGVQVWENPNAILPELSVPPEADKFAELSWGILPMFSLVCALVLFYFHVRDSRRRSPPSPYQPMP